MKVFVKKNIRSDNYIDYVGIVKKGVHVAIINQNGAISCKSDTFELIGIKLDEFEFLSKEDRESWISIAYPNIPIVRE